MVQPTGGFTLRLTHECELSCRHCSSPVRERGAPAPAAAFLASLERLSSGLNREKLALVVTGGEPFLYPELAALLEGLQGMGFRQLALATNGLKLRPQLDYWLERFSRFERLRLWLSLDGTVEEHEAVRNERRSYHCVLELLDEFSARKTPVVPSVNTTFRRGAMSWLPRLGEVLKRHRPNDWRIYDMSPERKEFFDAQRPLRDDYRALFNWMLDRKLKGEDVPPASFLSQLWWGAGLERTLLLNAAGAREARRAFVEIDPAGQALPPFPFSGPQVGACVGCAEWNACQGGPASFRDARGPWRCGYQILQGR